MVCVRLDVAGLAVVAGGTPVLLSLVVLPGCVVYLFAVVALVVCAGIY